MALDANCSPDSPLADLRAGQFLIAVLLWASAGGLIVITCSGLVVTYHYTISLAERVRMGLGFAPPHHGPDWFLLIALSSGPLIALLAVGLFAQWYRRLWLRRIALVWPNSRERRQLSKWQPAPFDANDPKREERSRYLTSLLRSPLWSDRICPRPQEDFEGRAEWLLEELEKDIAERALATGLTVGISQNRYIDLFTNFAAALELQLHVLSRLGKRPSAHAWRLLIQRCGASLFINSYLNRQDSLALNLMIKKAGMGLKASGDLMESASQHLTESDSCPLLACDLVKVIRAFGYSWFQLRLILIQRPLARITLNLLNRRRLRRWSTESHINESSQKPRSRPEESSNLPIGMSVLYAARFSSWQFVA